MVGGSLVEVALKDLFEAADTNGITFEIKPPDESVVRSFVSHSGEVLVIQPVAAGTATFEIVASIGSEKSSSNLSVDVHDKPDYSSVSSVVVEGTDKKVQKIDLSGPLSDIPAVKLETEFDETRDPKVIEEVHSDDDSKTLTVITAGNVGESTLDVKVNVEEDPLDELQISFKVEDGLQLKKYTSEKNIAWLELGVQAVQEFDSNGDSQGFNGTKGFGRFTFLEKLEKQGRCPSGLEWGVLNPINLTGCTGVWGFGLKLGSNPVFNQDVAATTGGDGADTGDAGMDNNQPDDNGGGGVPNNFNDISDTAEVQAFRYWSLGESSNWMVGVGTGVKTRDKLADNQDSLNYNYRVGIQYQLPLIDYSNSTISVPSVSLSFSIAHEEDYGGFDRSSFNTRYVTDVNYQFPDKSFAVTFHSNAGKGPDEFNIGFVYLFEPVKVMDFFAGN